MTVFRGFNEILWSKYYRGRSNSSLFNFVFTALCIAAGFRGGVGHSNQLQPLFPQGVPCLKLMRQLCTIHWSKMWNWVDIKRGKLDSWTLIWVCDVTVPCKSEPLTEWWTVLFFVFVFSADPGDPKERYKVVLSQGFWVGSYSGHSCSQAQKSHFFFF